MRIGLVVHDLSGGGAEAVARSWASGLTDLGHDVVFLLYGRTAEADVSLTGLPTAVFPKRAGSTGSRWTALPRWIRREADRRDLDVLLAVLDFSNVVALLAGLGGARPVIISEHAVPSLLWRHRGAGGLAKQLAARALYRRADAVLAVSHAVATDLRVALHVAAERIVVLSNPVPVRPPSHESGPAGPGRRVLLVGRCAPEKRLDRAFEVVRELRSRGLDWTGCVLGDGPLRAALETTAETNGLPVEFTGWVNPWQSRARPGDVLLVTSDLEGFGNVLVEAAAAGIPSVAPSPALGVADAVLPGVTAVLSPTTRIGDLADAVLRAADLPVLSPAVQTWLARFAPEQAAAALDAVLTRVRRERTEARQVVTQVGHSPEAQGGIASVLRTYRDAGVPGWRTRFLTSYVAGSPAWSAGPAAGVLLQLLLLPRARLGVVHVHLSYGGSFVREGGLALIASLRAPLVVTVHGSDFARFSHDHPSVVSIVLRRAARVILLSDAHRTLLPRDVQDRVVLVPNTVSDGGQPSRPSTAARAVFAGELSRRKGLDVLLEAWPLVRRSLPDAELVLAGPVGDVTPFELGGVRWAGAVDNTQVRSMLRESRIAVLPSRREAMPMFVLEAMSAGRAVVVTPIGAMADTVGEAGVVVPVGDSDALAAALTALLGADDLAERLGTAGRTRFATRFAPAQSLANLAEVYRHAAATRRARAVVTAWG